MTALTESVLDNREAAGRRWALRTAVFVMALTFLPYLFGWSLQGADASRAWYSWLGFNLDDSCVYLSWMRQAADGHFFQRNLFTTEAQVGHQFNVFFLLLGTIARLFHLPLILVYHASRLVLGVSLLRALWWLLEMLMLSRNARKVALLTVCFSAGLGWLPGLWRYSGDQSPVDVWQTEAITYLCLYLSPLFLVSLLLMVGVIGWLKTAERTGSFRHAVYAGLCGLLLGNIHTYDVITLTAVWGGYLVLRGLAERQIDMRAWAQAITAGFLTAISTGYIVYLLKTEEVFQKRADVATLSPHIRLYLLAYLPLLVLAYVGIRAAASRIDDDREPVMRDRRSLLLLVAWLVLNFAVAYLPVAFNRKMLMGEHLPLAILAGIGLYAVRDVLARAWLPLWLLAVATPIVLVLIYFPELTIVAAVVASLLLLSVAVSAFARKKTEPKTRTALAGAFGLLSLTNILFSARDVNNFQMNRGQSLIQRPYMSAGEAAALEWLREHAPEGAAIQPLPWIRRTEGGKVGFVDTTVACLTPGLTGRPVNAGHWGETPDFRGTMSQWVRFMYPSTPDEARIEQLRQTGVRYLVFSQKHEEGAADPNDPRLLGFFKQEPPPYLRLVSEASNEDADVYEVALR